MKSTLQTKEDIKARMLHHVAALCGVKNTDSLDPLIRILIEALAGEFQKTQQEINTFEKRILEKISILLTPGLLSAPYCAHAIAHALPADPQHLISPTTSFYLKRKITETDSGLDLHFTPVGKVLLTNGGIKYLVTGSRIIGFDSHKQKSVLLNSSGQYISNNKIWIGISLNKELKTLNGVHFYFEFLNTEHKRHLLATIRNAQWTLGQRTLKTEQGIKQEVKNTSDYTVFEEQDPMFQIEREVINHYNEHFLTVSDSTFEISEQDKIAYPAELENYFSAGELNIFSEKLLWISISTPSSLDEKSLFSLSVSMNAFPVLNRRIKESVERFKGITAIIPVKTEMFENFVSVNQLKDGTGNEYRQIPYTYNSTSNKGSYSIRRGGTEKIDPRAAKEYLQYLVEIVRDEYAAFSGFGQDTVGSLLKDLERVMVQIEQRVKQNKSVYLDQVSYICLEALNSNDSVFLEYWVTNCLHANDLPSGSKLKPVKGSEILPDSVVLLNSTSGGKKALEPYRHIEAFKYALLTHNRLITAEDLKAFCFFELGDKIDKVEVKKAFATSHNPKEGFVKCIELVLSKKPGTNSITENEWKQILNEAQSKMEMRSALNMNLKLVLAEN